MRLPRRTDRKLARTPREHAEAMTDLRDKDREIDNLLTAADGLVEELKDTLAQASATLRRSAVGGEEGDDDAG